MIYLNLKGGLGNMMFQIAAAKSISLSLNTNFSFPNLRHHLVYLSTETQYNPKVNYCNEYLNLPFLREVKTETPNYPIHTITFPFHYQNIPINVTSIRIDGFFQSEKYFKKHKEQILEMFAPDEKISNHLYSKYGDLLEKQTTSIHVRRGDYIQNSKHHFIQGLNYFNQRIKILNDSTEKFLIFNPII